MAEQQSAASDSAAPAFVRAWQRISPPLLPIFAVLTALIITVPFMVVTGGRGNLARGLEIVGTAYSALVEGATGLVINDMLTPDNLTLVQRLAAASGDLVQRDLRRFATSVDTVNTTGVARVRSFGETLAALGDEVDDEQLTALGPRLPDIASIGSDTLAAMQPLIADLGELERSEVRALAESYARLDSLSADDRAALEAVAPSAANYDDETLLEYLTIIDAEGIVSLERSIEQLPLLEALGLDPASQVAADLAAMAELRGGVADARQLASTLAQVEAAGITDLPALSQQISMVRELYSRGLLTNEVVTEAIENELPEAAANNLLVRRPGNRLVIAPGGSLAGVLYTEAGTPEAAYLRLGRSTLLFFPANLESMIVRSIPFVIAGLAVALGFKAGLFNIGAEGQLYIGATLAVWVGFSPLFVGLPIFIHLPLVLLVGIFGGSLWGAIPGVLKAFTGAHEVIVTIMLNFVAIRLVDWLIKWTNPYILGDPNASVPRTPYMVESARIPTFDVLPPLIFVLLGIGTALIDIYTQRRNSVQRLNLLRPILNGLLVTLAGLFLSWITVTGSLHLGLLIMIVAVWFTQWLLNRTIYGFELRTVGANPDAARYAGMSVRRNIILAMVLSGGLAGLAGVVELSGKAFSLQPEFFAGLGFDAIAVALLARTNPANLSLPGFRGDRWWHARG
nr:MAG: hypothetical protein DIU68_08550 [Chloroflexota bacterium]